MPLDLKSRRSKTKKRDLETKTQISCWIPEKVYRALVGSALKNRRSLKGELQVALEKHLDLT